MKLISKLSLTTATLLLCISTSHSRSHLFPWIDEAEAPLAVKPVNTETVHKLFVSAQGDPTNKASKVTAIKAAPTSLNETLTEILDGADTYFEGITAVITGLNTNAALAGIGGAGNTPLAVITETAKEDLRTNAIPSKWGTQHLLHLATLYNSIITTDPDVADKTTAKTNVANILTALFSINDGFTEELLSAGISETAALAAEAAAEAAEAAAAEAAAAWSALPSGKPNTPERSAKAAALALKNSKTEVAKEAATAAATARAIFTNSPILQGVSDTMNAMTVKNALGSTPLHYAALSADAELLTLFREKFGAANTVTNTNWAFTIGASTTTGTTFATAASKGVMAPAISTINVWGHSPVHYAAANTTLTVLNSMLDGLTAVQKLAALKFALEKGSLDKATPLHYAAARGNNMILDSTYLADLADSCVAPLSTRNNPPTDVQITTGKTASRTALANAINEKDTANNSTLDYAVLNTNGVATALLPYTTATAGAALTITVAPSSEKLHNFVINAGAWGPRLAPFHGLLMPGYDVALAAGR